MKWSAIALAHGVSSTTLRDRVKGHGGGAPWGGGAGRPTVLPLAAELQLVEWVRLHQVGGKAVVAMCLKKEAKRLEKACDKAEAVYNKVAGKKC